MKLQFYAQSLKADRKTNQDAMAHSIDADRAFFVVADGLGGYQDGDIIARVFCDSLLNSAPEFKSAMLKEGKNTLLDWFNHTIELMNKQLIQLECHHQAHTTCAILWIDPQQVITAHIGDSRIYRFNKHKKLWRTRDHSVPQMLLDEGEISEQEMATHPDQNRLTRSIDQKKTYQPTIKSHPGLQTDDTYLLCTDGFWSQSEEQELLVLAQAKTTEENLQQQAQIAIKRASGKSDNITWQWIRNSQT